MPLELCLSEFIIKIVVCMSTMLHKRLNDYLRRFFDGFTCVRRFVSTNYKNFLDRNFYWSLNRKRSSTRVEEHAAEVVTHSPYIWQDLVLCDI